MNNMAWFKKKKEVNIEKGEGELPELPKLPELPRLPELPKFPSKFEETESSFFPKLSKLPEITPKTSFEVEDIKSLPSFPGSEFGESLSQEAAKSAIPSKKLPPTEKLTLELPEKEPEFPWQLTSVLPQVKNAQLIPTMTPPVPRFSKKIEPVYIRIDKFKSAINSFQEIQAKLSEIDNLLRKINEQKRKEDEELREWEREIEMIKARIESIDKNIFSKLD